jgi:hypothetical protein
MRLSGTVRQRPPIAGLERQESRARLRSWRHPHFELRQKAPPDPAGSAEADSARTASRRAAFGRPGQPVVAAQTSMLPQVAGQSVSGQGAGVTIEPAASDAARQSWMAGQTSVFRTSIHSPTP